MLVQCEPGLMYQVQNAEGQRLELPLSNHRYIRWESWSKWEPFVGDFHTNRLLVTDPRIDVTNISGWGILGMSHYEINWEGQRPKEKVLVNGPVFFSIITIGKHLVDKLYPESAGDIVKPARVAMANGFSDIVKRMPMLRCIA